MSLTHGVYGIVAISVYAAKSAVADIDDYLQLLDSTHNTINIQFLSVTKRGITCCN